MSNSDMLELLPKYLCKYEQKEVLKYPMVYFFNLLERKLNGGAEEPTGTHNSGYDNDQGEYLYVNHDHIAYRFEIMRKLGKGRFGVVLKCQDHMKNQACAIKIIRNK
jgi:dual specificity tyrosine-phosphorylation-regulated kinase 2/3/4